MLFNGGWSYTNNEMKELFDHIDLNIEREEYSIIEFGGGDSSLKIYNLFYKVKNVTYYVVESNIDYLPSNNFFNGILYNESEISNFQLQDYIQQNIKFDLVLIDGPNGDSRKYWYNKIKQFVKIGTIILIDDFNHYESFGIELDLNYEYELLSLSMIPFVPYGEHSWKIVKVTNIK
jgi:hypothetical protein